jgi:Holliday junction DNA helicase RuvA
MITKMTGVLTRVLDDEARVEVGPFEYQVMIPEAVRRQVQLRTGQEVTFHVTEYLEGNQSASRFVPRRIGFLTELELEFFELFCTVEKIGAKKALKAMARPVKEIADAINRQDARWLSTLPGIGAATSEQIVTTLKRKVTKFLMAPTPTLTEPAPVVVEESKPAGKRKPAPSGEPAPASNLPDGRVVDDIYQALMGLGHSPIEARTRLDGLLSCGKPFKTLDEALTLIYATKG